MKKDKTFRRFLSLKSRYGLVIVGLVVIMLILNVIQWLFMDDIYTLVAKAQMQSAADAISSLDFDSEDFLKDISEFEASNNIYVEIYRPREVLVYTTNNNNWIFDSSLQDPDSSTELKPRIMKILSHNDIDDSSFFEIRQEYFASAKYIFYGLSLDDYSINIYSSVDVIEANSDTARMTIFWISFLFLTFVVALVVAYTYSFSVPLTKINAVTKKMAHLDFSEKCPDFKIKELDELSASVNALSASLDLTLKDLNTTNKALEQDIEKERKLEENRKQFIASASHELKTPISIIQGYAEGLKLGINDSSPDEYCDIIIGETEKMNRLVMRLLEMIQYDYGGYKLKPTEFNIREIFENYLWTRIKSIEEKGIEITINIPEEYIGYGDTFIIENVLGNYVSNAVSHAEYEKKINITCALVDGNYRVSVFNTGKPISDEDINSIWDSFYRADKAHSRAEGRFGLGLSIVVSAQNLHGQKYGVINHDNGVEFWFDIPKYIIPSTN